MTAKCLPLTRFYLILLSVIVVMTCLRSEATVSSAEKEKFQRDEDTRTPIASRVNSVYEERMPSSISISEEIKSQSLLENIRRGWNAATLENLQRGWQRATSAVSVARQAVVSQLLKNEMLRAKVASGLFRYYGVEKVTTKLFESPQFRQWAGLIHRSFPHASPMASELIFSQLLAHYHLQLPKLIVEAKQVKNTRKLAADYESMLFDLCIRDSLEKGSARVLQNKLLLKWYEETPDVSNYAALIDLRLRLEENKVNLDFIEAAEREPDRIILDKLKALKPYEVDFGRLGLHNLVTTRDLLWSPKFSNWAHSAMYETGMNYGEMLLSTLRHRALSDRRLLDDLFALRKKKSYDRDRVQDALIKEWTVRKVGLAAILHVLELDKGDDQFINFPLHVVLEHYFSFLEISDEDILVLVDTWFSNKMATAKNFLQNYWLTFWIPSGEVAKENITTSTVLQKLAKHAGDDQFRQVLLSFPNANKGVQRLQRCLLEPSCDSGAVTQLMHQPVDPVVPHLRFRE